MTTSIDETFASMAGQEIPGGCDDCDAVQTLHQEDVGIWRLQVAHDEDCPFLARHRARSERPPAQKRRKGRR